MPAVLFFGCSLNIPEGVFSCESSEDCPLPDDLEGVILIGSGAD